MFNCHPDDGACSFVFSLRLFHGLPVFVCCFVVIQSSLQRALEMKTRDNLLLHRTSWDWVSIRLNLPRELQRCSAQRTCWATQIFIHPYVYVQILAKLNLSAVFRRVAINRNLTCLKSASWFITLHISYFKKHANRSKDFSDAFCEQYLLTLCSTL